MPARHRFLDRADVLIDQVGGGNLEVKVVVDQVYAAFQHEKMDLRHPEGGGPKYLERALYGTVTRNMNSMRAAVLRGDLRDVAVSAGRLIAKKSGENAPFEFGDLKASGAVTVKDGGRIYATIPAGVKRLSKQELRIKAHLRTIGLGHN